MRLQMKPISRQSSVDQIAERIRYLNTGQRLVIGGRFPGKLELVKQFQVSSPALREELALWQRLWLIKSQRENRTIAVHRQLIKEFSA